MAATTTGGGTRRRSTAKRSTTRRTSAQKRTNQSQTTSTQQNVAEVAYARARQAAESVVDVPVGTALLFVDRVNAAVQPYTKRETAERELRSLRTQLRRDLNKVERRGGRARPKAARQAERAPAP